MNIDKEIKEIGDAHIALHKDAIERIENLEKRIAALERGEHPVRRDWKIE